MELEAAALVPLVALLPFLEAGVTLSSRQEGASEGEQDPAGSIEMRQGVRKERSTMDPARGARAALGREGAALETGGQQDLLEMRQSKNGVDEEMDY